MSRIMLDDQLKNVRSVAIAGHVKPDGDCVGSTLSVYNYIRTYYPDVEVDVYLEPIPNIFRFLKYSEVILDPRECADRSYDLFIGLDCGDTRRFGKAISYFESAKKTLCIDHHESNRAFAEANYIVPHASSTCELIYTCMEADRITKPIAECLYTGIINDTGVFQYDCTSQQTMEIAGKLMAYGIDFTRIVSETFFEKTYEQNRILGKAVMDSKCYMDGRVIATYVSQKDMEEFGVQPKHMDGIVEQLRLTKGVEIAVFMYENEDGSLKVSTRAKNSRVNLADLALTFQGGGHAKAAGFTVYEPYEQSLERILQLLKEMMDPA